MTTRLCFFCRDFLLLCLSYFALGILTSGCFCVFLFFFVFSLVLLRMAGRMRCMRCSLCVCANAKDINRLLCYYGCGSEEREEVLC